MVDPTPNLKLDRIDANSKAWTVRMNRNFSLLDSAFGAYFSLQNLQGVWENSHVYTIGQTVVDDVTGTVWTAQVDHTSGMIGTSFEEDRNDNPGFWTVFSSPARARGAWTGPGTNYAVNDFVVSGSKYAIAIVSHTSGLSFNIDEAAGRWSVLVDLSSAGSQVLPIPGGLLDANKFVTTTPEGTGYSIYSQLDTLAKLGATDIGIALLHAASAGSALSIIGAQPSGSYQPLDGTLTNLSGITTTSFGRALLALIDAAALRSAQGLGSAALLNAGIAALNAVQLDASSKLPAVDGSALLGMNAANDGATTYLALDVALNNTGTYFNGPNTGSIGANGQVWLISVNAQANDTVGQAVIEVAIHDGTNFIVAGNGTTQGGQGLNMNLMKVVTLTGPTTFTLKARGANLTTSVLQTTGSFSSSVFNKSTSITAVRLK